MKECDAVSLMTFLRLYVVRLHMLLIGGIAAIDRRGVGKKASLTGLSELQVGVVFPEQLVTTRPP